VQDDRNGDEVEASAVCHDDEVTLPYYVASSLKGFASHSTDDDELGDKYFCYLNEWQRSKEAIISEEETSSDEGTLLVGIIEVILIKLTPNIAADIILR
jgi:hypothetical protein